MSYYEVLIFEKCIKRKLIKTKYLPVGSEKSTLIQSETRFHSPLTDALFLSINSLQLMKINVLI